MTQWSAIFDFDGVIIDSERTHEQCWQRVAKKRGLSMSRDAFLQGFGLKNERFIQEVLAWTKDAGEIAAIIQEKEAFFQEIAVQDGVPLIPGVEAFLKKLQAMQVSCVIGSSSILKNIDIILRKAKIEKYFSAIVSGEDVHAGKPDPEVFIRCAEKIKTSCDRCVVFEDAYYGIEAAKRAKMHAIALTTTFSEEIFRAHPFLPDTIISSFEEVDLAAIAAWFPFSASW